MTSALVIIDLQDGFNDPFCGATNPGTACRENCLALADAFLGAGLPVVLVRHDSDRPSSPLYPGTPGNHLDRSLPTDRATLLVTKTVNSAFYGTPDLDSWLRGTRVDTIVVAGIQTNMCVETTARMGGNLGYRVILPIDATRTFDLVGPTVDGETWFLTADELVRATAVSLHGGGFAEVATTQRLLKRLGAGALQ